MIRLSVLTLFVIIIFVYVSAYFLPSIEHINLQKRTIKDLLLRIKDYEDTEEELSFINEKEREFIKKEEDDFKDKIPQVKSAIDFKSIEQNVFKHVENTAKKTGIEKMIIDVHSPKPAAVSQPLSGNRIIIKPLKDLWAIRRNELKAKIDTLDHKKDPLVSAIKDLSYFTAVLTFTGNMRSVTHFINQLPWQPYILKPDHLMSVSGKPFPNYILYLKVYYMDLRPKMDREDTSTKPTSEDLIIDYHSPLLLKPVYETYFEEYIARDLSHKYTREFLYGPSSDSFFQAAPGGGKEILVRLNVIDTTGEENLAVINNKVVKAGDYVSGLKVATITEEAVVLKHKEKEILLTFDLRIKKIKIK
jgi:hypothetical protein